MLLISLRRYDIKTAWTGDNTAQLESAMTDVYTGYHGRDCCVRVST